MENTNQQIDALNQYIEQALQSAQHGQIQGGVDVLRSMAIEGWALQNATVAELWCQAQHLLALFLQELQDWPAAELVLGQALQVMPSHELMLRDYAVTLQELGRWSQAKSIWQKLLQEAGQDEAQQEQAYMGLADAAYEEGDWQGAQEALSQVIALGRDGAVQAYSRRSMLYAQQGQGELARADALAALQLQPGHPQATLNLAVAEYASGQLERCQSLCEQLLAQWPDYWMARMTLGQAQLRLGEIEAAQASFERVLQQSPEFMPALEASVVAAYDALDADALERSLRRAEAVEVNFSLRWKRVLSRIAVFYNQRQEALKARRSFKRELAYVQDWLNKNGHPPDAWQQVGEPISHFYYIYHDINDRDLLSAYGDACAELMQRQWQAKLKPVPKGQKKEGRPWRLGIVSHHIRAHSIWWDKLQGLYLHAPDDFELYTFALGEFEDEQTALAQGRSAFFMAGAKGVGDWAEAIRAQELDFLYYPEVGLGSLTFKLACLRLAPRQLSSWGNPQTTGLPSMDAFISARCFEAVAPQERTVLQAAGSHPDYRESVYLLEGFPTYYQTYAGAVEAFDLQEIGLCTDRPILLCAGSAFKYQYDFAERYARLAAQVPQAQWVFFMGDGLMAEEVAADLQKAFAAHGLPAGALVLSPWLSRPRYQYLMTQSTLLLDSLGFSGINTVIQALEVGLPVVTVRGERLRGRLGSGVLDAMGLADWVAADAAGYEAMVLRLCQDAAALAAYRAALQDQRANLFGQTGPIEQFFDFLRRWEGGELGAD